MLRPVPADRAGHVGGEDIAAGIVGISILFLANKVNGADEISLSIVDNMERAAGFRQPLLGLCRNLLSFTHTEVIQIVLRTLSENSNVYISRRKQRTKKSTPDSFLV